MKKIATIIGLIAMSLGLLSTLYGYAADYTKLKSRVKGKATRGEVRTLHNKIDKVILGLCIIDKRTCILKERR